MRTFYATTEGPDRLGLRELLQRYADEQWVADHTTIHHARLFLVSTSTGPRERHCGVAPFSEFDVTLSRAGSGSHDDVVNAIAVYVTACNRHPSQVACKCIETYV